MKIRKSLMKRLGVLGITSLLLFSFGCGPKNFVPNDNFQPINIEERVAKKFNLRIDKLQKILKTVHKIDKPVPIFIQRQGATSDLVWDGNIPEGAVIVGYLVKEHNKLVAKIEHGNMMGDIATLLVQRIQLETEMYNMLIDYCQLQQDMAKHYRMLWIEAENRRLQAEYDLKVSRWEHKLTFIGTALGVIAVLML